MLSPDFAPVAAAANPRPLFSWYTACRHGLRRLDAILSTPLSTQQAALKLSLYLLLVANGPLWLQLRNMHGSATTVVSLATLVLCGMLALLSLTAWAFATRGIKLLWWLITLVAALAQYYMLTYGVVMDPGMLANVLQTDVREASDLLGMRLLLSVVAVMFLPTWWLLRLSLRPMPLWHQVARNLGLLVLALGLAAATLLINGRELAPLMRNHPQLRYLMNPLASLYSTTVSVVRPLLARNRTLLPMTAGTALGATHHPQARPLLFVLVVGETARSDHFGINGYTRNTTPQLAALQATGELVSWRNVFSCGTSTLASVPCMFSPLGKTAFEARKDDTENLLDIAQAAGLAVLWLENQSGCKGVCDRIAHVQASDNLPPNVAARLCPDGQCADLAMLHALDDRVNALPTAQRERGVLLVMHQIGSHGPAYYKRSDSAEKHYLPECQTEVLSQCAHDALINAYDNSIITTDAFLGHTIDWLRAQSAHYDTGLLYVSDHGESLGEYGLYLHGMPWHMAPDVQKHVPMVAWLGTALTQRLNVSTDCLRADVDRRFTHDHLFHTILGVLDIVSPTWEKSLDILAGCRQR